MFWIDFDSKQEVKNLDDLCKIYDIKNKNDLYGFTYKLVLQLNDRNYFYIGKKNFYYTLTSKVKVNKLPRIGHVKFIRKKEPIKVENEYTNDGKKVKKVRKYKYVEYEIYKKETDWLDYEGSWARNDNYKVIQKYILDITFTKRLLTYLEVKRQFMYSAIEDPNYINDNILGKFFRGNLTIPDDDIDYNNPDLATNGGNYV